ncbi:MAG: RusA family crossover junction endodeoxyribonuclease [Candidatus Izemoplasmatales bacterium]|nr:RusA family crossover junction endodeoxyribonuclease [Candidatus Izemoplasmatales bacterium]
MKYIKRKNRKIKSREYEDKFGSIPIQYEERLSYMIDRYKLTDKKMEEILKKRENMLDNLFFFDFKVVQLLELPEGAERPRFRLTKRNFADAALSSPFVHIYSPNARDDSNYMRKLVDEEIVPIKGLINTPCDVKYDAFLKTPTYYNITDTFLAEIGLIRPEIKKPDWDNISKKYSDMYNYNIWLDDSQVNDGSVHKYFSILPRVEIYLRYMNVVYNSHQYKSIVNRKDYDGAPIRYLNSKGEFII